MRTEMKRGFTLIELMVVIVLVMILALAIVPTFREIINKAKYTEGSSAISALRTNIKVFEIDNGRLPGLCPTFVASDSTFNGVSPNTTIADVNIDDVDEGAHIVQRLQSTQGQIWLLEAEDPADFTDAYPGYTPHDNNAVKSRSPLMRDLNLQLGDYAGAYFVNEDYQYMLINAGKSAAGGSGADGYGYAIAVTAGAGPRRPAVGTGYAVMELYCPAWETQSLVATWERYTPERNSGRLFLQLITESTTDYSTHGSVIPVPSWAILRNSDEFQQAITVPDPADPSSTIPGVRLDTTEVRERTGWNF